MIKIENFELFKNNMSTLKETSKDKHEKNNKNIAYMTDSLIPVVDFDKVKEAYIKDLSLSNTPKSNDALLINCDEHLIFIEFKNGRLKKPLEQSKIRKKIYDSVLIFTDIIGRGIKYTRKNMDYILVYNEEKNDYLNENPSTVVRESKSRDQISKKLLGLGNEHFIKFDLDMFENYCFRNVYTYTEEEFCEFVKTIRYD